MNKNQRSNFVVGIGACAILSAQGWCCHAFSPSHHAWCLGLVSDPYRQATYQAHPSRSTYLTKCQETRRFFHGNDDSDEDFANTSIVTRLVDRTSSLSSLLLLAPAVMAGMAFSTYTEVAEGFRAFVDIASGHTWYPVDGGTYLTDLISPALTGPVASFISLLFGTLTSMTVGNLYNRQATMAALLGDCLEDLRLLELHVSTLPKPEYRDQGKKLIRAYGSLVIDILEHGNLPTQQVKQRREAGRRLLEQNMDLLHTVSGDKTVADILNGRAMDEAYGTLNRLIRTRSSLITTYENCFPVWHYGNLCILALAILFIFLVLTDKTALLFLGGFQLRMCWSMLIGTLSMLAVVIYDLNTPLSGAFQVVKPMELDDTDLENYVETLSDKNQGRNFSWKEDWLT